MRQSRPKQKGRIIMIQKIQSKYQHFLLAAVVTVLTIVCLLVLVCPAHAIGRHGGGCANGQCGVQHATQSDCANGQCEVHHAVANAGGSAGGSYTTERRSLFNHHRSGGSSGESYSGGSNGGNGSAGGYGSAGGNGSAHAATTDCVCPKCGYAFQRFERAACKCCDKCTGKPGCDCGCANCTCNGESAKKETTAKPPVEK